MGRNGIDRANGAEPSWVRAENVLWRRLCGVVLLLRVDQGEPMAVTGPGADLWDVLEEPVTASAACTLLSRVYLAEPAEVTTDIGRLLAELAELGLVAQC